MLFRYNKLDGLVFECLSIWLIDEIYANFTNFLRKLYDALKKENMYLINVLFPYSNHLGNIITKIRFEYIYKYTDYFSLMTYDYYQYMKSEKK